MKLNNPFTRVLTMVTVAGCVAIAASIATKPHAPADQKPSQTKAYALVH